MKRVKESLNIARLILADLRECEVKGIISEYEVSLLQTVNDQLSMAADQLSAQAEKEEITEGLGLMNGYFHVCKARFWVHHRHWAHAHRHVVSTARGLPGATEGDQDGNDEAGPNEEGAAGRTSDRAS